MAGTVQGGIAPPGRLGPGTGCSKGGTETFLFWDFLGETLQGSAMNGVLPGLLLLPGAVPWWLRRPGAGRNPPEAGGELFLQKLALIKAHWGEILKASWSLCGFFWTLHFLQFSPCQHLVITSTR